MYYVAKDDPEVCDSWTSISSVLSFQASSTTPSLYNDEDEDQIQGSESAKQALTKGAIFPGTIIFVKKKKKKTRIFYICIFQQLKFFLTT